MAYIRTAATTLHFIGSPFSLNIRKLLTGLNVICGNSILLSTAGSQASERKPYRLVQLRVLESIRSLPARTLYHETEFHNFLFVLWLGLQVTD